MAISSVSFNSCLLSCLLSVDNSFYSSFNMKFYFSGTREFVLWSLRDLGAQAPQIKTSLHLTLRLFSCGGEGGIKLLSDKAPYASGR